ncbi:MAG: hypothetical protein JNL28_05630, partial [Planctomycetes bacterium]|nr:hypothetical protein [Planctomycetota bacterium]
MTSLSLRASLPFLAAVTLLFGPGPSAPAQGVDCTSTTCPPLTNCVGCPAAAPLVVSATQPPRDLGPRFNNINIGTFPDSGPSPLGALQRAEMKITIQPGTIRYRVENLGTTSADVLAQSPAYDVRGFIDVRDPTVPPGSFLLTTSDKVEGFGVAGCLKWRVNDRNLATTLGTGPSLPPFDGCYDFNDPGQGAVVGTCPVTHGGPCVVQPIDVPGGTCCPLTTLGGVHSKMGRSILFDGSCFPAANPPNAQRSGFTDQRVFGPADAFQKTICITDPARLNYFKLSLAGTPTVGIPLQTAAFQLFPAWTSSNLDQEGLVNIGISIEMKYFYCPTPPVCQPDTAQVCNTTGAMQVINVLANDTPTPGLPPIGGLDCALLTGTNNLTQGLYGTVAWVNDAACVNAACNLKCIKYTRNATPLPVGVTTDTFNYTIVGNNGCTATCPVTVTIASPVCQPDTADVCNTTGALTTINVLANDSSLRPLNCAALTGVVGLTQGTYGSVAWVTDAACVNGLCTTKCIRYTRNA